jgi:hypothetical protein
MSIIVSLIFVFSYNLSISQSKIEGKSSKIKIDLTKQSFKSQEESIISIDDIKIKGTSIIRDDNNGKNIIVADEEVTYEHGPHKVFAKKIIIDLNTKIAQIDYGRTEINQFFLEAKKIEAEFPKKILAKDTYITTCSNKKPHFRIEAKEVIFYPDSKFIAYNGWIYIGENFKLFPVPVYASYVLEKEDNIPLFPRIDFDEAKGILIKYGFSYKMIENQDWFIFPNLSAELALNIEASQNRGLGINLCKLNYSFLKDKNYLGYLEIKDWVSSYNEKGSQTFNEESYLELDDTKENANSIKFKTVQKLNINNGFLVSKGRPLIGKSKSSFIYEFNDSDLIKDPQGNYVAVKDNQTFTKINIDLEQKVWDIIDVIFKYKNISSENRSTIDSLLNLQKEEIYNTSDIKSSNIDTNTTSYLKVTQQDPKIHKLIYEKENNEDLSPESGRSGKSKFKNFRNISLNLKPIKLNIKNERLFQDFWSSKDFSFGSISENYVSSDLEKDITELSLGNYSIYRGTISNRTSYVKNRSRKFYMSTFNGNISLKDRAEQDYKTRASRAYGEEFEFFVSNITDIKSSIVKIDDFIEITPIYSIELKKYQGKEKTLNPINQYIDSISQNFGLEVPITLYKNYNNKKRSADIDLNLNPLFKFSTFLGDSPKDQKIPLNKYIFNIPLSASVGNINCFYSLELNRYYNAKLENKNLVSNKQSHSFKIKLDNKDIFTTIVDSSVKRRESEAELDQFPDQFFSTKSSLKISDLNLRFNFYTERVFVKNKSSILFEVIQQKDSTTYEGSFYIFGLNTVYKRRNRVIFDNLTKKYINNLVENLVEAAYKSNSENRSRINLNLNYSNQFDLKTSEYRDTELGFKIVFVQDSELKIAPVTKQSENIKGTPKNPSSFDDLNILEDIKDSDDTQTLIDLLDSEEELDIMSLGTEKKIEKLDRDSYKVSLESKIITDERSSLNLKDKKYTSWSELFLANYKLFFLSADLELARYFGINCKFNKRRDNIEEKFSKDTLEFSIRLGLGKKDYEFTPKFYLYHNVRTNSNEKIYLEAKQSLHCTSIAVKIGKAKDIKENINWIFGFDLSINSFPTKSLGMDISQNGIENARFGI